MNPKQQQILEAAIQCVHEVGIEKTNAKLIAERLDMPTSLIFYYFPKQHQIFESIVMYIVTANNSLETTRVASLGQITESLFKVGGQYRRSM